MACATSATTIPACGCADLDSDGDADLADFGFFAEQFARLYPPSGGGHPPRDQLPPRGRGTVEKSLTVPGLALHEPRVSTNTHISQTR
jgi:hypothetical protein